MRNAVHDLWGCGRGPVAKLAPPSRLLAGVLAFAAVMVAPAATGAGSLLVIGAAAVWWAACRPPAGLARTTLGLGLALFLPYFLLLPWIPAAGSPAAGSWRAALAVPWTVLLRGMGGMTVSLATVAALSPADLRQALVRLPVPRSVAAILLQIVQQAGTLFAESVRIASALAVRGALGRGPRSWKVLAALPQVWLPRVIVRAERVAAAMELRAAADGALASFGRAPIGLADGAVLMAAGTVLGLATVLRLGGPA